MESRCVASKILAQLELAYKKLTMIFSPKKINEFIMYEKRIYTDVSLKKKEKRKRIYTDVSQFLLQIWSSL